jgi:tetratricopeptide (TPR) repeat protein
MPTIKNNTNRRHSDDKAEAGRARKEEFEGGKKYPVQDESNPSESVTESLEDIPKGIVNENRSTLSTSEPIGSKSETSTDLVQISDEEVTMGSGQPKEEQVEEHDDKEKAGSRGYMLPDFPEELVEDHDVDMDTERDFDESEDHDIGIKGSSIEDEDETAVPESEEEESEAYIGGNAGLYYLRGLLYHQRMNLDDAIRYLGQSLELAVETDLFDYVVKSQIQLAAICLKRYRIHGDEKDYYSSLHYSENLIQIAKEMELDELWTEALLLRAILKKISKDIHGARDDLNQARVMARSTGQDSIEALIEHELHDVRGLLSRASRKKHSDEDNGESMMDDALEAIPAIFDESLKLEVSRESLAISVELKRLVIMNLASGIPLYTYAFDEHLNEKSDLVYGFLSALSHLASEVMDSPGMIRSITHEGSTVMMEHRGAYMAALFASREDFRARQSLQRFLREFLRLLPEMRFGEVVSEEYRMTADEMLRRIFRPYLASSI